MTYKNTLTAERLRELLDYNPATGVFTRRVKTAQRVKVGDVAGTLSSFGYVSIMVDRSAYKAHRLAWLHVHGAWPNDQIDHIDGDRANNRIDNLRDVSRAVNGQNQKRAHVTNPNKMLGVTKDTRNGVKRPFMAQIVVNGRRTNLGSFESPESAHAAYIMAKRNMHEGCTI